MAIAYVADPATPGEPGPVIIIAATNGQDVTVPCSGGPVGGSTASALLRSTRRPRSSVAVWSSTAPGDRATGRPGELTIALRAHEDVLDWLHDNDRCVYHDELR